MLFNAHIVNTVKTIVFLQDNQPSRPPSLSQILYLCLTSLFLPLAPCLLPLTFLQRTCQTIHPAILKRLQISVDPATGNPIVVFELDHESFPPYRADCLGRHSLHLSNGKHLISVTGIY